jgi:hypothetical protein
MATNDYQITNTLLQSLFGPSPEQQAQAYQQARDQQALQMAQLTPGRGAVFAGSQIAQDLGKSAGELGGAVRRGVFGIETPKEIEDNVANQIKAKAQPLLQQGDVAGYADFLATEYAKAGLTDRAVRAKTAAEQFTMQQKEQKAGLELKQAQARKATAEAGKYELSIQQEEKLRAELQQLGPNATEDQIIAVVTKYGSPDKVLELLQKKEMAKQSRAEKAAERAKKASMLPSSLQKEEDKDLASIDSYDAQAEALGPSIQNLTPNNAGVRKLQLGPVQNSKYLAQNLAGNSTEESRAFEALKSAVDTAVNLQVSAEKGVQTDKDVLRFAKALIGAFGRNDTQATLEALQRYKEAIDKAKERTKARLESRRKSQNVEPYYGNIAPPSLATPTITPAQPPAAAPQGQGAVIRFGRDANGNIVPLGGK